MHTKKYLVLSGFALFLIFCLAESAFAERVVLNSGKIIEGKILERADTYIRIEIQGIPVTVFLNEIRSISSGRIKRIPVPEVSEEKQKEPTLENQGAAAEIKKEKDGCQTCGKSEKDEGLVDAQRQAIIGEPQDAEKVEPTAATAENKQEAQSVSESNSGPVSSPEKPSTLSIDSPADGTEYGKGSTVDIRVSASEDIKIVVILSSTGQYLTSGRPFEFKFNIPKKLYADKILINAIAKDKDSRQVNHLITLKIKD